MDESSYLKYVLILIWFNWTILNNEFIVVTAVYPL